MATDERDQENQERVEPSDEEAYRLANEELHRMREALRKPEQEGGPS